MAGSVFIDSDNLAKVEVDWSGPDRFGGTIAESNRLFVVDTGANITTVSRRTATESNPASAAHD